VTTGRSLGGYWTERVANWAFRVGVCRQNSILSWGGGRYVSCDLAAQPRFLISSRGDAVSAKLWIL
jgi:hypothetical protein